MKIQVSDACYNEMSVAIKRAGREINDGSPLTIEKGDAIMPPRDFRMVAIRQNCLGAASEVFKIKKGNFLETAEEIFSWCLNGISDNSEPSKS